MKCVCGYEQKEPFENYKLIVPFMKDMMKIYHHPNLYICPKCGTIRFEENKKEGK